MVSDRWGRIVAAVTIGLASLSFGCHGDAFKGLASPMKVPHLEGVNWDGTRFDLEDLKGKVVFLMFGFTSCPGPCPASMSKIKRLREGLRAEDQVATVFVTIDPAHDDNRKLGSYVKSFATRSAGGNVIGWFGVRPASELGSDPVGPLLGAEYRPEVHSATVYLLDRQGRLRAALRGPEAMSSVIPYIEALLAEK